MKKTIIYCTALLAMGLASCDVKSDLGIMQTNPQDTPMNADGVTVSLVAPVADGVVNLENNKGAVIPVMSYSVDETFPAGATMEFDMEIAKDDSFANPISLQLVPIEGQTNTYGIETSAWDEAFRNLLGKSPEAKANNVRIAAYINQGMQHIRVGGDDTWFGVKALTVTPVDLHISVESAYYLVGSINNWDLSTAVKFEHSDKSQYDDPVFTLALDIPANFETDGYWWKIVPESAFVAQDWNGLFGTRTNGDNATEGVLYENGEAGCLKVAGQYLFTINMLDCTYSVTQAIPMLYTPGGGNGWKFETGWLNTWDFANYFGFVHLNGDFKVTDRPEWGGFEWGAGEEAGTLKLGGGNISGMENGLYWMNVNIGTLTYTTKAIESISVIGGFPDNNWVSDFVELNPTDDILVWTADINFADANIEWKFRTNGGWEAPNLGNAFDKLENDGGNLKAPGVGSYTLTLDLRTIPYKCSFVEK